MLNVIVVPVGSLSPTAVIVELLPTAAGLGEAERDGAYTGASHVTGILPEVSADATEPDGAYVVAEKLYVPAVDVVKAWVQVRVEPDHEQFSLLEVTPEGMLNTIVAPEGSLFPTAVTVELLPTNTGLGEAERDGAYTGASHVIVITAEV